MSPVAGANAPATVALPAATAAALATVPAPPFSVDASAWEGHGTLAFVSRGRLEVLSDAGNLSQITGPRPGGTDVDPAWSADGRSLAFLHISLTPGYAFPTTLWVVRAGSSVAHEVSGGGGGMFAWSPTGDQLAFLCPEGACLDTPGDSPTPVSTGGATDVADVAWSPDGKQLAFDGIEQSQTSVPTARVGLIGVVPAAGGPATIVYQARSDTGLAIAGWWPSGGGLLFWEDPDFSASLQADGDPLFSLATGADRPDRLATTLVGPEWLAFSQRANSIAIVAGGGRTIWQPGRSVAVCQFPAASCRRVATPPGSVSLAPSWSPSGVLLYAVGSETGRFGPNSAGFWDFSPKRMTAWNQTKTLWEVSSGKPAARVPSAPIGTLLASPSQRGSSMVLVADDSLWFANPSTGRSTVRIAGPLYSTTGPSGYYGEVAWGDTFAWSGAAGPRAGSSQTVDPGLWLPDPQLP